MTDLLECAKSANAKVIFGYEMLLNQGYKSFEIWTGLKCTKGSHEKGITWYIW